LLLGWTSTTWIYWLSPVAVGLILLLIYYAFIEKIVFLWHAPDTMVAGLYRRYYRLGRPLVGEYACSETAYEFTNKLIHKLNDMKIDSKNKALVTHVDSELVQLTNLYHLSLFSSHKMNRDDIRIAFRLWRRLRGYLVLARIRNFFQHKSKWISNKVRRLSFKSA
jgi:hypothetical protein